MKLVISVVLASTLASCGVGNDIDSLEGVTPDAATSFINSSRGTFADIRTGMSEKDLLLLGYPTSRRSVVLEGDEYPIIDVTINNGFVIECLFASEKIYSFSSTSSSMRDENNIGVGSKLAELERTYPQGRSFIGNEDNFRLCSI